MLLVCAHVLQGHEMSTLTQSKLFANALGLMQSLQSDGKKSVCF